MPVKQFTDQLEEMLCAGKSPVTAGMDPRADLLPPGLAGAGETDPEVLAKAYSLFAEEIIEAVAPSVVAIKFQSAFYERLGPAGLHALIEGLAFAKEKGLLTILDVKRGDIGTTAEAYADAAMGERKQTPGPYTDAVTVNPYLGEDSLRPFLEKARRYGKGVFVLVKTSNPSGPQLQDLRCDGRPVYRHVAELVHTLGRDLAGACGVSAAGAVIGATYPGVLKELRAAMPDNLFLLPGIGAQGARAEDIMQAFLPGMRGALITASRSILYAYKNRPDVSWQQAAGDAAEELARTLKAAGAYDTGSAT